MALPILDGNQTAATLSTVLTSGEHIPAHTVVSLGSQAITDVRSAVSGSVVSISNFPSTQTIAGTVTANVGFSSNVGEAIPDQAVLIAYNTNNFMEAVGENTPLPISGTVTANLNYDNFSGALTSYVEAVSNHNAFPVEIAYQPSVTIGSLPAISGTVTAAAPNGSLTTRFGTPTTANTAFATSAVTNANRKYLLIQNVTTGSNVITVGIGFTPTTTQGIQLTAGAGITFESSYIPTGAVYVLSSVTASNFTILEA